jgi:hypothetical protein
VEGYLERAECENVVDGAKGTLCFTILLRGVGTQHAEDCTLGEEEHAS